jgi:hypothetical protein
VSACKDKGRMYSVFFIFCGFYLVNSIHKKQPFQASEKCGSYSARQGESFLMAVASMDPDGSSAQSVSVCGDLEFGEKSRISVLKRCNVSPKLGRVKRVLSVDDIFRSLGRRAYLYGWNASFGRAFGHFWLTSWYSVRILALSVCP